MIGMPASVRAEATCAPVKPRLVSARSSRSAKFATAHLLPPVNVLSVRDASPSVPCHAGKLCHASRYQLMRKLSVDILAHISRLSEHVVTEA
ncbi:hypothetical protein GCM10009733_105680 [Nonomuraea maheshkhaliensis]|uniref:Uncharacterized protein n=1 Tax=Nonomuraea maheshkhaliensis TaxID=419590 RepID=A0ABP4TS45_9ACTN